MGSSIELLLDAEGGEEELEEAEREFHRLEALLSRFKPDSELSRLNEAGVAEVGPELLELAELALAARETTDGRFDPTVYEALNAAGYDRSFELMEDRTVSFVATLPRCGGAILVDRERRLIELEPGFKLDLGGIAKGWAADRALTILGQAGPALVNAAGDIAASGRSWPVGLDTPSGALTLEIHDGALATSGRDRRHWLQDGQTRHHIIDPKTSEPACSSLVTVTVYAASATQAEVLAKTLFLAGDAQEAAAEAELLGLSAVLVGEDGDLTLTGDLR